MCVSTAVLSTRTWSRLDARVPRRLQQGQVYPLPGLVADRPDRRLKRRLARQSGDIDAREAPRRERVPQRELQAPVGLPAQMPEHRAAQRRLAAQPAAPAAGPRPRAQVGRHLVEQFRMGVQPRRRPLQVVGDGKGWSTACGSNRLVCALRFSRIRASGVSAFPMFSNG